MGLGARATWQQGQADCDFTGWLPVSTTGAADSGSLGAASKELHRAHRSLQACANGHATGTSPVEQCRPRLVQKGRSTSPQLRPDTGEPSVRIVPGASLSFSIRPHANLAVISPAWEAEGLDVPPACVSCPGPSQRRCWTSRRRLLDRILRSAQRLRA